MNYVHENISRYSICGIVTLIVKMNCNRTDFAVGADSHVRTPDPGPGSDNVVHSSFSKVATEFSQNRWIIRFRENLVRHGCDHKGQRSTPAAAVSSNSFG